jgi:anti-sigma-K factor RskA
MIGRGMTHDEIRDRLEAYALGALEPTEREEIDRHLTGCEACRHEADTFTRVADALPAALAAASPTPGPDQDVRERLLRSLRRRPQAWQRAAVVAVAAGTLALVASLAWSLQVSQTLAQEREIYQRLAGQQEIVFEVIDSPDTRRIILRPPVSGSTSYGKVFSRPDLPFVVAMAGRLPAPPPAESYHLWLTLEGGETVLAGILVPNRDGFGALVYEADRNDPQLESVRVTLEPPGTRAPSGVSALLWSR